MKEIEKVEGVSFREKLNELNEAMKAIPGSSQSNEKSELGLGCKYEHSFTKGIYIRKMFIPKGIVIVTKIHKTQHPYFIMQGDVTVVTEDGEVRIKAPYTGITEPGTQRALFTHEDTVWITIHATDKKDVEEISKDVVSDSWDESEALEENKKGGIQCHSQQQELS